MNGFLLLTVDRRLRLHRRRRNILIVGRLLAFLQFMRPLHRSHNASLRVGDHQLSRLLDFLGQEITQLRAIGGILAIEGAVTQIFHLRPRPEAQRGSRLKQVQPRLSNLRGELLERSEIVKYPNGAPVGPDDKIIVSLMIIEVVNRSVWQAEPEQVPPGAVIPSDVETVL